MTTYYPHEAAAKRKADELLERDDRIASVKVELEPYNGWVVVVMPRIYRLDDLLDDGVEIREPVLEGKRISPRDEKKKVGPPLNGPTRAPREPRDPSQPRQSNPGGYSTHASWTHIEKAWAEKPGDRDYATKAVIAAGFDSGTASKQTRRWMKTKGHWS